MPARKARHKKRSVRYVSDWRGLVPPGVEACSRRDILRRSPVSSTTNRDLVDCFDAAAFGRISATSLTYPNMRQMHALLTMNVLAVDGNFVPVEHSIIADDAGDTQTVILEDGRSAQRLGLSMCLQRAPF